MTSNQELRKREAKNAAPEPGIIFSKAASKAAKEAREATMAAIAKLVDNAAAKNGGRVPKGLVPEVIQKFSKVVPGLTRDQINHYKKKHKRSATTGSDLTLGLDAHAAEASLSPTTVSNNLPEDDADPPNKRQKGGRPKGTTMKSLQAELENYQKASAEAARDYQNALDDVAKEAVHRRCATIKWESAA
jgi:DNA replication initiation complex subunit (GINS family)